MVQTEIQNKKANVGAAALTALEQQRKNWYKFEWVGEGSKSSDFGFDGLLKILLVELVMVRCGFRQIFQNRFFNEDNKQ